MNIHLAASSDDDPTRGGAVMLTARAVRNVYVSWIANEGYGRHALTKAWISVTFLDGLVNLLG